MKLKRTQIFDVDLEGERIRLRLALKGEQLKRHLHLVDLFEQQKSDEFFEAYDNLPRDEEGGFPEQEIVGDYYRMFFEIPEHKSRFSCVHEKRSVTEVLG